MKINQNRTSTGWFCENINHPSTINRSRRWFSCRALGRQAQVESNFLAAAAEVSPGLMDRLGTLNGSTVSTSYGLPSVKPGLGSPSWVRVGFIPGLICQKWGENLRWKARDLVVRQEFQLQSRFSHEPTQWMMIDESWWWWWRWLMLINVD